jgi:hypothetical protein
MNEVTHDDEPVNIARYFVLGQDEARQTPDNMQTNDPWMDFMIGRNARSFLSSALFTRVPTVPAQVVRVNSEPLPPREQTVEPLFTREQYEPQSQWMRGTVLDGLRQAQAVTVEVKPSTASGSNDPIQYAPTAVLPVWMQYDQERESRRAIRPFAPQLYRMDYADDELEPVSKNILDVMTHREPDRKTSNELSGLYAVDMTQAEQWQRRFTTVSKDTQDELAKLRSEAKAKARRKFKAKLLGEKAEDGADIPFDGSVTQCVICLEHFVAQDLVCRLVCRHVIHDDCLKEYKTVEKANNPTCPECRGTLDKPKSFKYIHENQFACASDSSGEGSPSPKTRVIQTKRTLWLPCLYARLLYLNPRDLFKHVNPRL